MECQGKTPGESSKMLEMMNVVLKDRDNKARMKKRHKKAFTKHSDDERPLVDQIFKPGPKAPQDETNVVALDCEMVEVDRWSEGLARVSIVNFHGVVLMDKFVIPEGKITNYRTWVSGVTPDKLLISAGAMQFQDAKKKALAILKDKIIVGHSLGHDFQVLEMHEGLRPKERIRDLGKYKKYQSAHASTQNNLTTVSHGAKSLKKLSQEYLKVKI